MISKKIFEHLIQLTLILTSIISLTSCAFGGDKIHLEYSPRPIPCPQLSGNDTNVEIVVHDKRLNMKSLGCKGFGHDIEKFWIELEEDLSDLIASALNLELNHFHDNSSSDRWVEVEIHKFQNEFKVCGFVSGKAEAELILLVQVKNSMNHILYSRVIVGKVQREVQIAGSCNAQIALEAALNDAIHQLLEDPAFLNVLSKEYS